MYIMYVNASNNTPSYTHVSLYVVWMPFHVCCQFMSQFGLGVVYTMDCEVLPNPCNICDWLLNLSPYHFGLHQGKNVKITMKFEVPKIRILRPLLSTVMVQHLLMWERRKRCSSRKGRGPWKRNVVIINLEWNYFGEEKMKTRGEKRMVKLWMFFKPALFGHKLKKITRSLFSAWSFLIVHFWCIGFVNCFFQEIGPWKLDHQVGPLEKAIFHGLTSWFHGVKRPLEINK